MENYAPFYATMLQTWWQRHGTQLRPDTALSSVTQPTKKQIADVVTALRKSAWVHSNAPVNLDSASVALLHRLQEAHVPAGSKECEDMLAQLDGEPGYVVEGDVYALQEAGEEYKAYPKLCQLAFLTFAQWGPDHPYTVRTVFRVTESHFKRGQVVSSFYSWLLPRAVEHWGIGHPDTLRLVQHSAINVYMCPDPRDLTELTQLVLGIAQQLPGGLGWGSAVVAPVPDEEAYNRNAFLMTKATHAASQGHYKLAGDMLKRCVAYYETLGCHWLGSPRKVHCMDLLAEWEMKEKGPVAAEPLILQAKRTALRELGPNHEATLTITW